ncbi:uncharacterized protein EV422DRAFT_71105 [Fimicolochytrium jonesii]|uniref:uncharacterized protein n=1 Tax=Fimicolochytrium jonesii TaxID=1396493 RepID=UPI0022FED53B|nr:uncharacterized protein EV422DRAFT_71105 [Fimicolochytrium jonesii]KAI8820460.1 hypothetical protein EV422DRAFT_71105 [Fimicolochytrium jonesii]
MATQDNASSTSMSDFEAFERYDWDADERFQSGLQSILAKGPSAGNAEADVQKAKTFYYSKFVKPIDLNAYLAWKSMQSNALLRSPDFSTSPAAPIAASESGHQLEASPTKTHVDSAQGGKPVDGHYPRSFQEICEMIAKGEQVPGIRDIPNKLQEARPSSSTLAPRKKPWETQSVDTLGSDKT